jgi:hypothetical protein
VAETTVKTYAAGFDALVKRRDKCISVDGEYVEEYKFYFQFRISHVLRFISICDLFTDAPLYLYTFSYCT